MPILRAACDNEPQSRTASRSSIFPGPTYEPLAKSMRKRTMGIGMVSLLRAHDIARHLGHKVNARALEGEPPTDCRRNVAVVVIRDTGAVRNGDGQTAADVGIRNARKSVEALGEVMIHVERRLVEGARAG